MKRKLITLITIISLLITLAACGNKGDEGEPPDPGKKDPLKKETVLDKWQTEDGSFTYELFEDGTLVVGSDKGEDLCSWVLNDDTVGFRFSDGASAGYVYNSDKDILESTTDTEIYLVRAQKESGMSDTGFEAGKEYELREDLRVRERPSTESALKKATDLADEDKSKALDGEDAVLKKGSVVKCRGAHKNWILTASGWICGGEQGRVYLMEPDVIKMREEERDRYLQKIGVDPDNRTRLSGTYAVSNESTQDSVELFEDGDCVVHYVEPMVPVTDEEGYTNGYYAVKGNKVYINCGGSVYAETYAISGNTLRYLGEKTNLIGN